jgi:hypothetical protein
LTWLVAKPGNSDYNYEDGHIKVRQLDIQKP